MATINIHAGDFLEGPSEYRESIFGDDMLMLRTKEHRFWGEEVSLIQLESVDIATEENVKKIVGTVGWGIAGATLLGPVGLLAGLLLGGKKKEVTFVAKLKDGRKFLGTTESRIYTKLQAALF